MSYITISLSDTFEFSLFQLAALYVYSKIYSAEMIINNQSQFVKESLMFQDIVLDDCHIITDTEKDRKVVKYGTNIILEGVFKSFKLYDDVALEFMRNFVYSNEDHMYSAYNRYNDIKNGSDDNDMVSLYYEEDANLSYYKKAIILANKQNVVIFAKDASKLLSIFEDEPYYNVEVIWEDNVNMRFILLSFFKHNIIQYDNTSFSLWASYISKYDTCKTVIAPEKDSYIMNNSINYLNIVYL
jgi:hypothetical protein